MWKLKRRLLAKRQIHKCRIWQLQKNTNCNNSKCLATRKSMWNIILQNNAKQIENENAKLPYSIHFHKFWTEKQESQKDEQGHPLLPSHLCYIFASKFSVLCWWCRYVLVTKKYSLANDSILVRFVIFIRLLFIFDQSVARISLWYEACHSYHSTA